VEFLPQPLYQLLLLLNSREDGLLMLKAHVGHVLTDLLLLESQQVLSIFPSLPLAFFLNQITAQEG